MYNYLHVILVLLVVYTLRNVLVTGPTIHRDPCRSSPRLAPLKEQLGLHFSAPQLGLPLFAH